MNNEELNASIASLLKQNEPPVPPTVEPSANQSTLDYLRNRDALVQLKERESSLPSSYGDSMGWVLYCLWSIPISVVIVAGGPLIGPSIAVFIIIYIINGWLEDGKRLMEEEEQLAKEFRTQKRNSRKKKFFKRNENGEMVEEDSP